MPKTYEKKPKTYKKKPKRKEGRRILHNCGQSYKGSTIVNYDSSVVIWGNFKSGTTLES